MCALCGVRWRGGIGGTGEVAGDEAKIDAFEQPGASQAVEFGGSEPEPRHTAIDLKHRGERPSGGPGKTGPAMHLFERIEEGNGAGVEAGRSEEHTSELQSLMRISYAVFCLKKKTKKRRQTQ